MERQEHEEEVMKHHGMDMDNPQKWIEDQLDNGRKFWLKFGTNESGAIWWPNLELMLPCGH